MKTLILLTAALSFSFASLQANNGDKKAAKKNDANSCLHISGIIDSNDDPKNCIVELISPNQAIDTVMLVDGEEKFDFNLRKNTNYLIRISKQGYLNKTVIVNTSILMLEDELHSFEFEIELVPSQEVSNLNKSILDYPVAVIHYDYQSDTFIHDVKYSELIRKELRTPPSAEQVASKPAHPLSTNGNSFLTGSR